MAPKNATWLKHLEAVMGPLARLAQNLQGEKGVFLGWFVITNCFCFGSMYFSGADFMIFFSYCATIWKPYVGLFDLGHTLGIG